MFSKAHQNWLSQKQHLTQWDSYTKADVENALNQETLLLEHLAALISPVAEPFIEIMAQKAQAKTRKRFGYTMNLFTPLYLSNHCVNSCVYCGFQHKLSIMRKTLTLKEIEEECKIISEQGFRQILLVSGEHPTEIPLSYLKNAVKIARKYFCYVAMEVYPLNQEGYHELVLEGLEGVTLFQETYHQKKYEEYHPKGPKANFEQRLNTLSQAALGGVKKLNLGVLLGLWHWREEVLSLAFHLSYLQKNFWSAETALSFPRIRSSAGGFAPPFPLSDLHFIQMILALRLYDEQLGMVLSTRESQKLRNALIPLGITSMSAGAKTGPGGHLQEEQGGEDQFKVSDNRSAKEMSEFLINLGYEPVWKDWERVLSPSL